MQGVRLRARHGSDTRSWAFIDFLTPVQATASLLNARNHSLHGRELTVEYASLDAVRRGCVCLKTVRTDRAAAMSYQPACDRNGTASRRARLARSSAHSMRPTRSPRLTLTSPSRRPLASRRLAAGRTRFAPSRAAIARRAPARAAVRRGPRSASSRARRWPRRSAAARPSSPARRGARRSRSTESVTWRPCNERVYSLAALQADGAAFRDPGVAREHPELSISEAHDGRTGLVKLAAAARGQRQAQQGLQSERT